MIDTRPRQAVSGGPTAHPAYSRSERLADAILHVIGVVSALLAVPVIVTLVAVWLGDPPTVGAAIVYGCGLIAMLTCSAIYHMVQHCALKQALQRLDHAVIYLKIACTYTLFATLLAGEAAGGILAAIWAAALLGFGLKLSSARRWEIPALMLYFAMGWAVLVIGEPILTGVAPETLSLMMTSGVFFTVGVVFLYWTGLPYHYAIWHGFVLVGTYLIYAAIFVEVARRAPVF